MGTEERLRAFLITLGGRSAGVKLMLCRPTSYVFLWNRLAMGKNNNSSLFSIPLGLFLDDRLSRMLLLFSAGMLNDWCIVRLCSWVRERQILVVETARNVLGFWSSVNKLVVVWSRGQHGFNAENFFRVILIVA